jgi:hypothetical protein
MATLGEVMINLEEQFGIVLVKDTTGVRIDRIVSDTQARKRLDGIANPVNFPHGQFGSL